MSKFDRNRIKDGWEKLCTNKQTERLRDRETDRQTDTTKTTPCLKKTSYLWLAITLTHMNAFWYFFGRNVTDKVGNQRCFTMPPQITSASALPVKTRKPENHIFHSIGLCYTHNAPACVLSSWKKKVSSVMYLIASNICWDSKISH